MLTSGGRRAMRSGAGRWVSPPLAAARYESERERRYAVLYLHDGSNVYIEWRIDETAKRLIAAREIEPVIIVLVPNGGTGQDRFED